MSKNTRQKLLATAADLFYREGFHVTGVDTISAASGVGKMTLYRHFASKDDLIVAYLNEADTHFWEWFEKSIAQAETPREKILAVFEALVELAANPVCHGCPFHTAAVDFPENSHPGHAVSLAHKKAVNARFRELAEQAGYADPALLADQLLLLMDGAYISIRIYGAAGPATQVASAAKKLLATWE